MSVKIDKINIRNFKSIKDASFSFSDFTPLVGYNNAGKSNILDATYWILRKNSLKEADFFDIESPVIVEASISGITKEVLDGLDKKHRDKIKKYVKNNKLEIQRVQKNPSDSSTKIKLNVKFFKDEEGHDWDQNPTGIDNAIKNIFPEPIQIFAMDDSIKDVSNATGTTTIGKLIKEIISPIEQSYEGQVASALQDVKKIFDADGENRAEQLEKFDKEVNDKLNVLFPSVSIKLHIPTPSINDFFKSGTLRVYEDGQSTGEDISSLGTGAQRSIQMALIRQLADVKSQDESSFSRTLLLIDEPELYLHPQAIEQVRFALKKLIKEGYQVIFSTHSPLMVTSDDVHSAVLVRKDETKGTYARKRSIDAIKDVVGEAPKQLELMFNLGNSSQILFSESAILTEGKTEHKVLPKIFEQISGSTLGLNKIALIRQGGVDNTWKSMQVLDAMDIPSKAIVDLDFAFKGAIQSGLIQEDDSDIAACKKVFKSYEDEGSVKLNNGLPTNKGKTSDMLTTTQAFEKMAQDEDCQDSVIAMHDKLKESNIWLWTHGAIEAHCGLDGKKETHWANLVKRLQEEDYKAVLSDPDGIEALVAWICE